MSTILIIYFVITYLLMWFISIFMVGTMYKPSVSTKIGGVLLVLFAPITLPLFLLVVLIINTK